MDTIETKWVQYKCPSCNKKEYMEIPYVPGKNNMQLKKGRWCSCGAIHELTYKIYERQSKIRIKVIQFLSDDETFNKRFILLDQQPEIKRY